MRLNWWTSSAARLTTGTGLVHLGWSTKCRHADNPFSDVPHMFLLSVFFMRNLAVKDARETRAEQG